jgi:hypothetical protein
MKEESLKNKVFDILHQKDFICFQKLDDYSQELLKVDSLRTFNKNGLKKYTKDPEYKQIESKVMNFIIYLNDNPDTDHNWIINNRYDYIWKLI